MPSRMCRRLRVPAAIASPGGCAAAPLDPAERPPPMVPAKLQLQSWFASPVVLTQHPDPARMNAELEALFLMRETDEFRNKFASHIPQAELFESAFSVFKWTERCVLELRSFMLDNVGAAVAHLNGYKPEEMTKLTLENHTWFHVMRHGASFAAHNHPNASWSAVYCVRAGSRCPGVPIAEHCGFWTIGRDPMPFLTPAIPVCAASLASATKCSISWRGNWSFSPPIWCMR